VTNTEVVRVEGLGVRYPVREGFLNRVVGEIQAVDDVSFSVNRGETLGLVGESGAGKTTIGRAILRAIEPTDGKILFHVDDKIVDVTALTTRELRAFRPNAALIFQDPYSSLNPRMTVRSIIAEPLVASGLAKGMDVEARVREVAAQCKLTEDHLSRYPHAFSGGQRQRIGIARALVASPKFIVADESVSALDVSIQAEILNLLQDLQSQLDLAILFIAHDLSVVAYIADRQAVLYLGQIVELAPTKDIFATPRHPYTAALLAAIPEVDPDAINRSIKLEGEIPSHSNIPTGCRFHTRCPYAVDLCGTQEPEYREIAPEHWVRCHLAEDLSEELKRE